MHTLRQVFRFEPSQPVVAFLCYHGEMSDEMVEIVAAEHLAVDASSAELVEAYLRTLQSPRSRSTMMEGLRRITRACGASNDVYAFPWHALDFHRMMDVRDKLAATGHRLTSVNGSLSGM